MTVAVPTNRYLDRPAPSSLADVINTILDKGLVLDVYLRASLLGIELLTLDARVVISSVDTYPRFAEAVNRLDLTQTEGELTDIWEGVNRTGARIKTQGAIESATNKVSEFLFGGEDRGT